MGGEDAEEKTKAAKDVYQIIVSICRPGFKGENIYDVFNVVTKRVWGRSYQ